MSHDDLQRTIDDAWEARESLSLDTTGPVRDAVGAALDLLDSGQARVAEKIGGAWHVNQWLKKAVLLSFRLNDMVVISGGPGATTPVALTSNASKVSSPDPWAIKCGPPRGMSLRI